MGDVAGVLRDWAEQVRETTGAPEVLATWRDERGAVSVATGEGDPGGAFRIASVTKTFVAAAVLRLVEEGRLDLAAQLPELLGDRSLELLTGGGFAVDRITLDHLLAHTSGLPDHAADPDYVRAATDDLARAWTAHDQVAWAATAGPVAPAGTLVSYSDTGYVLLGEVLERTTGQLLGPAVRELLDYGRLGLRSTWWEVQEPAPDVPRTAQYLFGVPLTDVSPTVDLFGGGGLVSTTADLARFFEALVGGEVVGAGTMLAVTPLPGERPDMGRGVFREEVLGRDWWSHGGFWGTYGGAGVAPGQALGLCLTEHVAAVRFSELRSAAVADLARQVLDRA